MRNSMTRLAVAALTAASLALLPGTASASTKTITYKGHTSQGKPITVKFIHQGRKGLIRITVDVVGSCPVQGMGANATLTQSFGDQAHGQWPIPSKWGWDNPGSNYDFRAQGRGGSSARSLTGKLQASWDTNIDNAPHCQSPIITFKVKRK